MRSASADLFFIINKPKWCRGGYSSDKEIERYFMAQYEEFTIDQGSDVAIEIHLVDADGSAKNLTSHSANAKMKKSYNSDSADTISFTATIVSPATDGILTLALTNTQTDALRAGKYVYDAEISYQDSSSNTIIERVLEGRIQVTPSVTK